MHIHFTAILFRFLQRTSNTKQFKTLLRLSFCILAFFVLASCGGGSGKPASGNVSVKAVFMKTGAKSTDLPVILHVIGIARLTLDALPVHPENVRATQVDLLAAFQQSGATSHTISNLTDNETYLFRIMAYDQNGTCIYAGQNYATLQPDGANIIAINVLPLNGSYEFTGVTGTWSGIRTDATAGSTPVSFTVDSQGSVSGSDGTGGAISGWILPALSGGFDSFLMISEANSSRYAVGNIPATAGSATGTAMEYTKSVVSGSWSFSWISL